MALTKEDLQAIGNLMDEKLGTALAPINKRLDVMQTDIETVKEDIDAMKENIEQIKEHAEITRETVNAIGEWTEAAAGALKINYPIDEV